MNTLPLQIALECPMRPRIGLLIVLVLAGTSYAAWTLWPAGTSATTAAAEVPPLFVPDEKLNVGEVWESPSHTIELPVENRSSKPIEVTHWTPACSCSFISVEPSRLTIGAGETVRVRVKLDLTTRVAESKRDFETNLVAFSGGQEVSPRWLIRGTIRTILGGLPQQVECGPISDLANTAEPTVLDIAPAISLHKLTAVVDPPWATADVQPVEGTHKLRVIIRPKLPVSASEWPAVLRLEPIDPQGDSLPAREVKLLLRGVTDVQPSSPRLLLGTPAVGESVTAEIAFRSLTGKSFEVEPVSPLPLGILVEKQSGSDSPSFGVTLRAVGGSQVVQLQFRIRQPNRLEYTVRVEVAYHGVAP